MSYWTEPFIFLRRRIDLNRRTRLHQTDNVSQKSVLFYKHPQAFFQVQFIKKYIVLQYFFPAFPCRIPLTKKYTFLQLSSRKPAFPI